MAVIEPGGMVDRRGDGWRRARGPAGRGCARSRRRRRAAARPPSHRRAAGSCGLCWRGLTHTMRWARRTKTLHLLAQQGRVAALPAVGHDHDDGPRARPRRAQPSLNAFTASPRRVPPDQSGAAAMAAASAGAGCAERNWRVRRCRRVANTNASAPQRPDRAVQQVQVRPPVGLHRAGHVGEQDDAPRCGSVAAGAPAGPGRRRCGGPPAAMPAGRSRRRVASGGAGGCDVAADRRRARPSAPAAARTPRACTCRTASPAARSSALAAASVARAIALAAVIADAGAGGRRRADRPDSWSLVDRRGARTTGSRHGLCRTGEVGELGRDPGTTSSKTRSNVSSWARSDDHRHPGAPVQLVDALRPGGRDGGGEPPAGRRGDRDAGGVQQVPEAGRRPRPGRRSARVTVRHPRHAPLRGRRRRPRGT